MTTVSNELRPLDCVIMRGGTSKGVFFRAVDIPSTPEAHDALILAVMGSPDPRQIDGLGGADPLTSKIAIIGPPSRADADLDYTFGQVSIENASIRWAGNCGNISAAVGVYAVEEGLVEPQEPYTLVRVHNTNTNRLLLLHVPIRDGAPLVHGDATVAGVPGTGAPIRLDFAATVGANTGRLLPTGNLKDELFVPELDRTIEVSIVDVAKATLFFTPESVGIEGTEGPDTFTQEILDRFWALERAAAKLIGLRPEDGYPTPVSVRKPVDYANYMGGTVRAEDVSFVARRVIGPPPRLHKAFAGTGGVCTAVASLLPGTVVHDVATLESDGVVRIGHPTGVFPIRAAVEGNEVREASLTRTARRIMQGTVYVAR